MATWRVDQRPMLTIEAAREPFSRVTGAARLSDGRVVVADRDTRKIHYFDRTGRLLRTVGGLGKGPGEFDDIDHFERRGDNLVVYDGNHAVHLLDAGSGRLMRRVALARVTGFVPNPAVGIMRDQSILFAARKMERPRTEPGIFSDSLALFRVADTTAFVEWFPTEVMHRASGARAAYLVGFGPRTRQVVFDDRRCHGYTARYEIRCTSPAGMLLLTIVREIPIRSVTNRERTAYRRAVSGFRSDGSNRFQDASLREHRARVAEQTAFATTHPVWFDLMASHQATCGFVTTLPPTQLSQAMWFSRRRPRRGACLMLKASGSHR